MIRFQNDYSEGAHPRILQRLTETNVDQTEGYGEDRFCAAAQTLLRKLTQCETAAIHFLVGGTQANLTVIAAALRPHQGALACDTGHIATHETGAIEAAGHKVLALPHTGGKLTAAQIEAAATAHQSDPNHEHTVQPGLVYLSYPTEYGTLYTRAELTAISAVCRQNNLFLYIDGARMGYGLAAAGADMDLPTLAALADAFTIGLTKQGALFGEALILLNPALQTDFRYHIKQRGGMLAKGRLLGLQCLALLEDNLYFDLATHANAQADRIRAACAQKNIPMHIQSPTNQVFPILTDAHYQSLSAHFVLAPWERVDETHLAVRICTSWATREEDVTELIQAL